MAIITGRSATVVAPTGDVDGYGLSAHERVPALGHYCQYCGGPAEVYDVDGAWCGTECQRFDRQNETTVRDRWSS